MPNLEQITRGIDSTGVHHVSETLPRSLVYTVIKDEVNSFLSNISNIDPSWSPGMEDLNVVNTMWTVKEAGGQDVRRNEPSDGIVGWLQDSWENFWYLLKVRRCLV